MSITPENQTGILAPNDLTEVAQPDTLAPNNLTEVAQPDVAAPNNLTEVAQTSVASPVNVPKVNQTAPSAPTNLTEVAQPAIVAPTAITALAQPVVNRPTPPLTLDLQFSKGNYQIGGVRGSLTDLITFNRATTATYVGRTQNQWGGWEYSLKTAAINEPRLSYDPATGESLGLLIEGSSTNLLTYSGQFTGWLNNGTPTITPNSGVAPDGLLSASLFSVDGFDGKYISASVANDSYTFSAFLKSAGSLSVVRIGNDGAATTFNCATGEVVSTGADSVEVTPFGNGWYRVSATSTETAGSSPFIIYGAGATSDFYAWGAQLEQKPYATSYIKTEASQVTRAADLASVDDLSAWYNQSEGSFYAEAQTYGATARGIIELNSDSYDVRFADGNVQSFAGTTILSQSGVGTYTVGEFAKIATVINSAPSLTLDGVFYGNSNPATIGAGTSLQIGRIDNNTALTLDGHIKTLSYYPAALSQSEMELITL